MIDHHSYTRNLTRCEIIAWKKKQLHDRMGFEAVTSVIPEHGSTNCTIKLLRVSFVSGGWFAV